MPADLSDGSDRVVLVHGGAGPMRDGRSKEREEGCRRAAGAGFDALADGGSPLDAVVEATVVLEDDPIFNAGTGSYLARDGRVHVDAAVMEGRDLGAGAVAVVRGVKNPVRLARRVLDEDLPHVLYTGPAAEDLARRWGLAGDPEDLVTDEKRRLFEEQRDQGGGGRIRGADTVGAIALADGRFAVAQSTGGTAGKVPGRIGDAPLLALGLYADDGVGAAMATGLGEGLMRVAAARRVLEHLAAGAAAAEACRAVVDVLDERVGGSGGVVCVAPDGSTGRARNTPHMSWARAVDGRMDSGV